MALISQYSSTAIEGYNYIMFFESREGYDMYADVWVIIHEENRPDPLWTLWTFDINVDEIPEVTVDLEREDPKYQYAGYSETFNDLNALLCGLSQMDCKDFDKIAEETRLFFE